LTNLLLLQLSLPPSPATPLRWVEQDPIMILDSVKNCMEEALKQFSASGKAISEIKAVGITNQRESIVLWDGETGKPLHNAISEPTYYFFYFLFFSLFFLKKRKLKI
jgi:sugar (pentulose or hexulose) kinase